MLNLAKPFFILISVLSNCEMFGQGVIDIRTKKLREKEMQFCFKGRAKIKVLALSPFMSMKSFPWASAWNDSRNTSSVFSLWSISWKEKEGKEASSKKGSQLRRVPLQPLYLPPLFSTHPCLPAVSEDPSIVSLLLLLCYVYPELKPLDKKMSSMYIHTYSFFCNFDKTS